MAVSTVPKMSFLTIFFPLCLLQSVLWTSRSQITQVDGNCISSRNASVFQYFAVFVPSHSIGIRILLTFPAGIRLAVFRPNKSIPPEFSASLLQRKFSIFRHGWSLFHWFVFVTSGGWRLGAALFCQFPLRDRCLTLQAANFFCLLFSDGRNAAADYGRGLTPDALQSPHQHFRIAATNTRPNGLEFQTDFQSGFATVVPFRKNADWCRVRC